MSDLDELRAEIAALHGLPPEASTLLSGTTLDEVERSAAALAKVLGAREREQADPLREALQNGPALKEARNRALADLFCGRPAQPRDEHGRFTAGFDGGARQVVPSRRSPEAEHDELVVALSRFSRAYGGHF